MGRDVVVIGSGCAGSATAWEFARNGWSVTVLERGRHLRDGVARSQQGQLGQLGAAVGGTSLHYNA